MRQLLAADLKLLFRNKQALFWTIVFPLLFVFLFGLFFGNGSSMAGSIGIVNQSSSPMAAGMVQVLEKQPAFKIKKEASEEAARDEVRHGGAAAALVIPPHFGEFVPAAPTKVTVLYDAGSVQARAALEGFVSQFLNVANLRAANAEPVFGFTESVAQTGASTNYFDFVLVGLIGMALMNSALQGIAIAMSRYRDAQILKRIVTTPLPAWKFVSAEILSRLVLNLIQVGVILGIGMKVFGAHVSGSLFELVCLALSGAILFQLAGFAVASVSKTTEAAEGMSQAIAVPMMFLAGVFFPIDQLPAWLYGILKFLPLSPLLRTMRSVALEHGTLAENFGSLILVAAWIVVLFAFAARRFRLVEE